MLNQQAPKKSKVFCGNQKPHLNKSLRAAIMKRSRLKNRANKSRLPVDLSKCKKQRNLVVTLNKKHKKEYFEDLNVATNSKPFWDKSKPYYMNNFLNKLPCRFRKAHSTQHALFKLLQAWQKELDNLGFIRTILMDPSKAYNCLPHDLLIAKLGACGLERSSLRLLIDCLNSRKQRTKVDSSCRKLSEIKHGIP